MINQTIVRIEPSKVKIKAVGTRGHKMIGGVFEGWLIIYTNKVGQVLSVIPTITGSFKGCLEHFDIPKIKDLEEEEG